MRSAGIMVAIFVSLLVILVGFTSGAEVASGEEPPVNRKFYARLGDREYLSPHLSGLRELALTYLPKSLKLLNIIEAYREITNSIKYELVMATVDSDNTQIVCQIIVKKRPWMQFQLEQRGRRPEKTNCSSYYDGETVDESDFNDADPQPSEHDHRSEADMTDVESQIIPQNQQTKPPNPDYRANEKTDDDKYYDRTNKNFDTNSDSEENTEKPNDLTDKNKSFLDQFFNMEGEKRDTRDVTSSNWYEHFHSEIRRKRELNPEHSDESDFLLEDQTEDEVKRTETARKHFEYFLKEIVVKIPIGNDDYRIDSVIKPKLRMNALVIFKAKVKVINATGDQKQCSVYIEKITDEYGELSITCPHERQKRIQLDQYNNLKNLIFGTPKLLEYTEYLFKKYRSIYDKQYSLEEFTKRFEIFRENVFKIELLKITEQGTGRYGITEFADMTEEEYRQRTGLLYSRHSENAIENPEADIPDVELPKQFDWREKGVVSRVKNQKNCGSCWAFSVTGNIEGLHAVRTGKLEEYSEQELLDCDTIDKACGGGLPDDAYKAIEQIGGLELENEYPYKAKEQKCHFDRNLVHVKIHGAVDLPKNETAIALWLMENGPVSIGINANAMQFYRGGVSHPWRFLCRRSSLDHGVLIVGFGVSEYPLFNKTMPYWIIKNSWDKSWGEQGYYRVFRGDNSCGVSEMASSAVLA